MKAPDTGDTLVQAFKCLADARIKGVEMQLKSQQLRGSGDSPAGSAANVGILNALVESSTQTMDWLKEQAKQQSKRDEERAREQAIRDERLISILASLSKG